MSDLSWSPTADKIAYVRDNRLFTLDVRTHVQKRLTGAPDVLSAAWSPDGRVIALAREPNDRGPEYLYLIDPDGTNLRLAAPTAGYYDTLDWSALRITP